MKSKDLDDRSFTKVLYELRVISNNMRKQEHSRIINWIDDYPRVNGERGEALTFVLPTKGCKYAMAKHGGCSMCTLPMDNPLQPSENLINSLPELCWDIFIEKGGSERFSGVKFYTSGSFLDRWELPLENQKEIIKKFEPHVEEITIETRCEYVIKKNLDNLIDVIEPRKLIIAIGQETTDDEINRRSINKGHTLKQFTRAVNLLKDYKIQSKSYILLKSIFVSELASLQDVKHSVQDMKNLELENISINPSYIGKKTLMDEMFKVKKYRPPWLWTVLYATRIAKKLIPSNVRIVCDPVAAGSIRGPRNCGQCDDLFKSTLKEFSATQDEKLLYIDELRCSCENIYKSSLFTESIQNGMGMYSEFPLRFT